MSRSRYTLAGVAVLLLSAALLFAGHRLFGRYTWTPVREAFDWQVSSARRDGFEVDLPSRYQVLFQWNRSAAGQKFLDRLRTDRRTVDAEWTLHVDGLPRRRVSPEPVWNIGIGAGVAFQKLGEFDGGPGHVYDIEMRIREDLRALSEARPQLVVRADPAGPPFRPRYRQSAWLMAIGVALAGIGLVLVLWPAAAFLFEYWLRRGRSRLAG